jgi:flagellar capping protein FliD
MVQITSNTGIVSGIDYSTLITSLIKADSTASDAITAQNKTLTTKQTAMTTLMTYLTSLKGTISGLGQTSLYDTTSASSSNSGVISVATTGTPAAGTYQYTALQKAQSQQSVSSVYSSANDAIGAGSISFRFGQSVDTSVNLSDINGGAGFTAGKIKITDRSGTSAIIDLSGARTIDDVLNAINNNGTVDVAASMLGDSILLRDNTGLTTSNLKVQEVNSGKTAASLGLAGINAAANAAAGSDIVYLSNKTSLNALNDGIGVEFNDTAPDISFTLSNGSVGTINLAGSNTVGDIINKINSASTYLSAKLNADGKLTITDSSKGSGTFTLEAGGDSKALTDLGLTGSAISGTITGTFVMPNGTSTVLDHSTGVRINDYLPEIAYTLANGSAGTIKLHGAATVGDIIGKINAASQYLHASIDADGKMVVSDSSTGTGTFTLAAANNSTVLSDLGLASVPAVGGVITGGAVMPNGASTVLDHSTGVRINSSADQYDIAYTLSNGGTGTIALAGSNTIGDIISAINAASPSNLAAGIDADGKLTITDSSGGAGTFAFQAANGSMALSDLGLTGPVVNGVVTGTLTIPDGGGTDLSTLAVGLNTTLSASPADISYTLSNGSTGTISLLGSTTIGDIVDRIKAASPYLTAAINTDGKLTVSDSSGGTGTFTLKSADDSKALSDLGLNGTAVSGVITSALSLSNGLNTTLSTLRVGVSVGMNESLPDFSYTLGNGETGEIRLAGVKTLGDIITRINASSTHLTAAIGSDGSRLVLTDSSGGTAHAFTLTAGIGSKALEDLGLDGTAVNGVITGSRIISGAKTVLLSDLNGGNSLGTLGKVNLTDRAGNAVTVDLASAETLEDVISAINSTAQVSSVSIKAQVNAAGNGIELLDTSGATAGNLKAQNYGDGTSTATKIFGAEMDVASTSINSGDMHLRVVGLNTKLSDLNGGAGVGAGKFTITDSKGKAASVNIDSSITTIGDVIKAINLLDIGVLAELNATGDGISVSDSAGGTGKLKIEDSDYTAARDLGLTASTTTQGSTQVIDGSTTRTITLTSSDTLTSLKNAINGLYAGIYASIVSDGTDQYYLQITGNKTGSQGAFILDTSKSNITFDQVARAQDAVLAAGSSYSSSTTAVFTSHSNDFTDVLPGATLSIASASSNPVTVRVATNTATLTSQIQSFVNNYNTFRKELNKDTAFDTNTNTAAALTGDYTAYLADVQLSNLITTQFTGNKTITSLMQLGIGVNKDDGTLTLDTSKLSDIVGTNLDDVKAFFTTSGGSVADKFSNLIDGLAGETNSLMELSKESLQKAIDRNQARIDDWTKRLSSERTRLTVQFANLELILSKLQNNATALDSIQWMTTDSSSSSSSGLFSGIGG